MDNLVVYIQKVKKRVIFKLEQKKIGMGKGLFEVNLFIYCYS